MIFRESRRFFKSSRLLSLTGVLVLAVGLGSSAVATSLLLALNALRYPGMPAHGYATIAQGAAGGAVMPIPWARFEIMNQASHAGLRMAAYSLPIDAQVAANDLEKTIKVAAVSSGFFPQFTLPLIAGKDFTPDEAEASGTRFAILSADLARAIFHSPDKAIGQQIIIKGSPYLVTGIASPSFHGLFGTSVGAWVSADSVIPLLVDPEGNSPASSSLWKVLNAFFVVVASDTSTSTQVAKDANRWLPLRAGINAPLVAVQGISVDPGRDEALRRWMRLGLGFSLAFALVSCLNVCLLLMGRAPLLVEEVRLRHALGARTSRILIELAVGPLAMMSAGLLASLALWIFALNILVHLSLVDRQLLLGSARLVLSALALQALIAFLLILSVALAPAVVALRASAAPRMGLATTTNPKTGLLMQAPVTLQIACGIGIWILAGMITSSLFSMMRRPLGFDPVHRAVISITISNGPMVFVGKQGASDEFLALNRVIHQLRSFPGIRSISYVNSPPIIGGQSVENLQNNSDSSSPQLEAGAVIMTSGYFRTMGTRLLRGRDVSAWPENGAAHEIVLNELASNKLFPGQDPIQHSVTVTIPAQFGLPAYRYQATVVGVSENMRAGGYASSPLPTFYEEGHSYSDGMPYLVVDGNVSSQALETLAKKVISQQMPGMKVRQIYGLDEEVQKTIAPEEDRAIAALSSALAMAVISFIGLYGSLVFYLRSKRREMAIRICLGASPWAIRRMVITRALVCILSAAFLSLPLWFVLRSLSSYNYLGPASWSWSRAILIALLCVIASALFSCLPAASTASISPSEVLKEQ